MHSSEKQSFDLDYFGQPGKMTENKEFTVRVKLLPMIAEQLTPVLSTHFNGDARAMNLLAQRLVFLPSIQMGWGPLDSDYPKMAKELVDSYLVHVEAFTSAQFPEPAMAAFEALTHYSFEL